MYRVFPLGGVVSPAMRDQPLLLQKPWIRPLVAEFGPSEFGRVPKRSVAASVGWSRPSSRFQSNPNRCSRQDQSGLNRFASRAFLGRRLILRSWKQDAENRPVSGLRFKFEHPAMFIHDARGNRQAEAGAVGFRAEERIKEPVLDFARNTRPGVFDFQSDHPRRDALEHGSVETRTQRNGSLLRNGLTGILHKVDQHLLELIGITAERS